MSKSGKEGIAIVALRNAAAIAVDASEDKVLNNEVTAESATATSSNS